MCRGKKQAGNEPFCQVAPAKPRTNGRSAGFYQPSAGQEHKVSERRGIPPPTRTNFLRLLDLFDLNKRIVRVLSDSLPFCLSF